MAEANTVTVICRLPSGITLDLYDMTAVAQRSQSGNVAMSPPTPIKSVFLNGVNKDPHYVNTSGALLGLGGRTQVDKDFWDAWLRQNASSEIVKRNAVFAEPNEKRALDRLASEGSTPIGVEPLDPNNIPGVKRAGVK